RPDRTHVESRLLQSSGDGYRPFVLANDHRDNRRIAIWNRDTRLGKPLAQISSQRTNPLTAFRFGRNYVQAGVERGGNGRRGGRRKNERARALLQILDRPRGSGNERPGDTERFPRRIHGNEYP